MPCYIGMTTDEAERKAFWEKERPTLHNWKVLHRCKTKDEAQMKESYFAAHQDCTSHPGGAGPAYGDWLVYRFDY